MRNHIYYEIEPETETETVWVCFVEGCKSICFDEAFKDSYGCAKHGDTWIRVVRQFQGGKLVSEFREKPNDTQDSA